MFFHVTTLVVLLIIIIALVGVIYSEAHIENRGWNKLNHQRKFESNTKRVTPTQIIPSVCFISNNKVDCIRKKIHATKEKLFMSSSLEQQQDVMTPKMVVFDLDGCLWRPEMYELLWYSSGKGEPFRPDPSNPLQMLTTGNEPVYLLGDVREVMADLYNKVDTIQVGISSRTDEPNWAKELLQKFTFPHPNNNNEKEVSLQDVIADGPIEISHESKVNHFQRISQDCHIPLKDMMFFDNERGNCKEVAKLGVTVAYCPDGVTNKIYQLAMEEFPQSDSKVIGIDVFGYDTLEGAKRLY